MTKLDHLSSFSIPLLSSRKGEQGDPGIQGITQPPGQPGRVGDPGFQGLPGLQGREGDRGPDGFPGLTGQPGGFGLKVKFALFTNTDKLKILPFTEKLERKILKLAITPLKSKCFRVCQQGK